MPLKHLAMVIAVVAAWGFNFVFIRLGVNGMPPLILCALRFLLVAFPAALFVPKPKCSWRMLSAYGLVMFALQFSFLFSGIKNGMSPALGSLIMQFQAFFSMFAASWIFKEKPTRWQLIGATISFVGILTVAVHTGGEVTLTGIALTLLGAMSWGTGNILSKIIGRVPPFGLVVWGNLIATPVMFAVALSTEGWDRSLTIVANLPGISLLALFYIVVFSTHVAYTLWSHLLTLYPTPVIAPFTLLVPVFGFIGSYLFLGESIPLWKVGAGILVILGLCFNLLESRIKRRFGVRDRLA